MGIFNFTPADEYSIQQQLGKQSIPDDVLPEYLMRIRMFHRAHGSGPLGSMATMEMLRFLGYELEGYAPEKTATDWRSVQPGAPVLVEMEEGGNALGNFQTVMPGGTLIVRLKKEDKAREVPKAAVKLRTSPELKDIDLESIGQEDAYQTPAMNAEPVESMDLGPDQEPPESLSLPESEEPPPQASFKPFQAPDQTATWDAVDIGTPVEVMVGEETKQGVFAGMAKKKKGNVLVKIDGAGQARSVPQDDVDLLEPAGV